MFSQCMDLSNNHLFPGPVGQNKAMVRMLLCPGKGKAGIQAATGGSEPLSTAVLKQDWYSLSIIIPPPLGWKIHLWNLVEAKVGSWAFILVCRHCTLSMAQGFVSTADTCSPLQSCEIKTLAAFNFRSSALKRSHPLGLWGPSYYLVSKT